MTTLETLLAQRRTELLAVNQRTWPATVELSADVLIEWAGAADEAREYARRLFALANSIMSVGVFYLTDPAGGWIGYRYGLHGHEYVSGFNDEPVRLVNGRLEEI